MKPKFVAAGAGFLGALLVLTYLYTHGINRYVIHRRLTHAMISRALVASASLDANLMKARNFMLPDYKAVLEDEEILRASCQKIHEASLIFDTPNQAILEAEATEACKDNAVKISDAEEFTSKNLEVLNSILYLQAVSRGENYEQNLSDKQKQILTHALSEYIHHDEKGRALFESELANLLKSPVQQTLAHHLRNVVNGQEAADAILKRVVNSQSRKSLLKYRDEYFRAHEGLENASENYRRLLFWCSLLLLAAVMYGVVKLVESSRRLQDAYGRLEQRVGERTRELSASHELILQQQNSLVASTKMSALGEMAGGVAHEINNPLAIIQTVSAQLGEILAEGDYDPKQAIDMASSIFQTTKRIAKIVQGLRTFSRDGSDDPFDTVNVETLINDTVVLCQERYRTANVKLLLEGAAPSLEFSGRSTQISQVLLNLLNNSFDAISADAERWVRVRASDEQSFVQLIVEDSGTGLTPEVHKKLFQPFFTTKEIGKGTGMGLSISLGLVQAHGGTLEAFARPNTCFVIRLPKQQPKAVKAA